MNRAWLEWARQQVVTLARRFDLEKLMLGGYAATLVILLTGLSTSAEKFGMVGVALCYVLAMRLLNSVMDHRWMLRNINTAIANMQHEILNARMGVIDPKHPAREALTLVDENFSRISDRLFWDFVLAGFTVAAIAMAPFTWSWGEYYDWAWNVSHSVHGFLLSLFD